MNKKPNHQDYFVYVHRRADNGHVFYVGKGKRKRCFSKRGRNEHWSRVVEKYGFYVELVLGGLSNELACELECELINFYGMDRLTNKTTGGEGAPGRVVSHDVRMHMSKIFKGVSPSKNTIKASIERNSKPIGTVCGLRFSSTAEAVKYLRSIGFNKACSANIHSALKGVSKLAYGYEFRYQTADGALAESNYKPKDTEEVLCSNGMEFAHAYDAARWCIDSGLAKNNDPVSVATNIYAAINGRKGVVFSYGFKWKNKKDKSSFREKLPRKGFSVSCSNGMEFRSINAAAKFIGGENNKNQNINLQIKKCCEGLITEAYGYNWRYLDDSAS